MEIGAVQNNKPDTGGSLVDKTDDGRPDGKEEEEGVSEAEEAVEAQAK